MWFTFVTARLFIFLSFQPRLAATLLRSCSVVNSPTRRVGLAPTFRPASLAQALLPPVQYSAVIVGRVPARGRWTGLLQSALINHKCSLLRLRYGPATT